MTLRVGSRKVGYKILKQRFVILERCSKHVADIVLGYYVIAHVASIFIASGISTGSVTSMLQ